MAIRWMRRCWCGNRCIRVLIKLRPVRVLRMTDDGEGDEKIIGVSTGKIDATWAIFR